MKTRILSYLLVFSMILALLPASALAEGESTTTPHITATVKHALDSGGAETGQITAQIEAYLTDKDNQSRTVKPCDIIFLIEQSAFMNTQNDTTQYGQAGASGYSQFHGKSAAKSSCPHHRRTSGGNRRLWAYQ